MLAGAVALAAGCQGHDAGRGSAGVDAAAPSSTPAAQGAFAITINNVTRTRRIQRSRLDTQEAAPGDAYIVLDVTVSNPGDQTRLFSGGPLIAVDGPRQQRFETPENVIADGYLLLEALAPGATERGRIVYEVPEHLPGNLYWQPMGGKRLLVRAGSHANGMHQADAAPRTLAQAPDDDTTAGTDAGTEAKPAANVDVGADANTHASIAADAPGPAAEQMTPRDAGAVDAQHRAVPGDALAVRQMRQLACRALVRDNAAGDRPRYLAFFNAQCHGFAMPSAWIAAPAVARAGGTAPAATTAPSTPRPTPDDGGPSFDCAGAATRAQQLVCADALLSLLDRQLADAYASAQREVDDPGALQRDQADWRQRVRDACQTLNCLERVYTQRTAALRAVGGFADAR